MNNLKDYPNVYRFPDANTKNLAPHRHQGQWHSLEYYAPDPFGGVVILLDVKKNKIRFGRLKEIETADGITYCFEYLLDDDVTIYKYSTNNAPEDKDAPPTNYLIMPNETGVLSPIDQFLPTHFMPIPTEINTSFNRY